MSASNKSWNAELYARTSRYVSERGRVLLEMLDARPGERILDLGCGDGALTEEIAATGAEVVGVDASAEMVEAARARGIDARVVDARRLDFEAELDGVFTNAALHWVREAEDVVRGVRRALRPGGRFVGEFGGRGNVAKVRAALGEALARRGVEMAPDGGWYFPGPDEYGPLLERHGFRVESIALIDRPTEIPGDGAEWIANFGDAILTALPEAERPAAVAEANALLEPELKGPDGVWRIDYVRIRFRAVVISE